MIKIVDANITIPGWKNPPKPLKTHFIKIFPPINKPTKNIKPPKNSPFSNVKYLIIFSIKGDFSFKTANKYTLANKVKKIN